MPTRAAVYVRISKDREGTGLGVERQEDECRELAGRLKWQVHDVYCDNDISASRFSNKKRPDYERLLADMQAGVIQAVIAFHPSRLHRRPRELEPYIDISEARGIPTHTCRAGHWDLSTPSGRMVARQLAAVDAYESEQKSDLVKAQRRQRAKKGRARPGGPRPYGFESDGVEVRTAEAKEVVRLTEAVVTGQSLRSLVRDLTVRGVPTATGSGQWTSQVLRGVILRPRNAGLVPYEVVAENEDGNEVKKVEYAKALWKPLVPQETWQAAHTILTDENRVTTPGGTVKWLGSGLYVCGVCQQPEMQVVGKPHGGKTYRCGGADTYRNGARHVTRSARSLDRYVEALLVERISDPRVLAKLRETDDGVDTRALRVELAALGTKEDRLGVNYATGKISERVMNSGMKEIAKRKEQIDAQLERAGKRTPLDPFKKAKDAKDVADIWYGPGGPDGDREGGLSLGARRAILDRLLTITVKPNPKRVPLQPDGTYLDRDSIGWDWKQ
jgi:DNA invertase Pin-like site-specific DNA recombinase